MTILEQIKCRGCSQVFHHRMLEFKIGDLADYDMTKTCPHCGEKNVDTVTINGSVPRFRFRYSPRGASVEIPRGSSFLQDAMQRAAEGMRERMQESVKNAMRGHPTTCKHGARLYGRSCLNCKREAEASDNEGQRKQLK